MKIVIASDIHGSYRYAKKLMEAYQREGASEMILLGDLYYHGPRNLLQMNIILQKLLIYSILFLVPFIVFVAIVMPK